MKTRGQIIKQNIIESKDSYEIDIHKSMQEYADQQTKELREEIERLKESKWISVEERLPKDGERVLIITDNSYPEIGEILNGSFVESQEFKDRRYTTHWQPLPNNPI
jgi:hypothetical protein